MKDNNFLKMNFEQYLKTKQYSSTSIATYERFAQHFLLWAEGENIIIEQIRYPDILAYMKHCSLQRGYSQRTVKYTVIVLDHYFDYLMAIGMIDHNPAKGIKVRGVKRKTLYKILEPLELNSVYEGFKAETISQKKNKVIVGLLVFQGLKTEEVDRLEVCNIKLTEGMIEIRGSKTGNGRRLSFEPRQIMDIHNYVTQLRPQILEKSMQKTDRLFVSFVGGHKLRFDTLIQTLKVQNPKIENPDQIRASVIVKWLKNYDLRQVQYLAGHRFISSTEAYKQNEMEGLTEEVNQFHPMG